MFIHVLRKEIHPSDWTRNEVQFANLHLKWRPNDVYSFRIIFPNCKGFCRAEYLSDAQKGLLFLYQYCFRN
jgi:hypothetical protein